MELEKKLSKTELIHLLEHLVDALKSDKRSISIDGKTIALPEEIVSEFEYEEEEGEAELEIELKWPTSAAAQRTPRKKGCYELFKGKDDQWYFHLKSANHQIILVSEGYTTKASALKGIESVRNNAQPEQFERRTSKSKQPYFVLKAKNGEIIGCSQMYRRKCGCDKGIRSVIHSADGELLEMDVAC